MYGLTDNTGIETELIELLYCMAVNVYILRMRTGYLERDKSYVPPALSVFATLFFKNSAAQRQFGLLDTVNTSSIPYIRLVFNIIIV